MLEIRFNEIENSTRRIQNGKDQVEEKHCILIIFEETSFAEKNMNVCARSGCQNVQTSR